MQTFTRHFNELDRAIVEVQTYGFALMHVRKGSDKILGATLMASSAGDLIPEITPAMPHHPGLKQTAAAIHSYPTHAEFIRQVADAYNRTRLTLMVVKPLFSLDGMGEDSFQGKVPGS